MDPKKFFAELRRRNVYKVAVAYGVVSWLLIQIATQVFPIFEIPNWAARLIVLLLALAFPIALVLAWIYELTPEGISRTTNVAPDQSIARRTGRKLDLIIIAVLVAVIGILLVRTPHFFKSVDRFDKRIAVLPFENRSEDTSNTYFADGVQDEILTRLSKISDLKVISGTSTERYKSAPRNLGEIGQQLRVGYLVEGSVQKVGDEVRIHVQLIKASNDAQLWAETFDRELTSIFAVESEVAKTIAEQLQVHLTGREQQIIEATPTRKIEAHDAYLRGLAFASKGATTPANSLGAQKWLREAVRLDPNFAQSWALLSYVDSLSYISLTAQATEALRAEALEAAETALRLQPKIGEGLLAKGYYYYACLRDYDKAVHYFNEAREVMPNSSRIPESLAYVARRRGQWKASEAYFREAEQLDPRNVRLLTQHSLSLIELRHFAEAKNKLNDVLKIVPGDPDTLALLAAIAQAEGDLKYSARLLSPLRFGADDSAALETQVYQSILERRPQLMISRLEEVLRASNAKLGLTDGELRFWLGWAQQVAGNLETAKANWRRAREELEPLLAAQPGNYLILQDLALIHLGLGEKEQALELAQRDFQAISVKKDAIEGVAPLEIIGRINAGFGDADRAIAALEKVLVTPYDGALGAGVPLTPALLRLDPMFDLLRANPSFQNLTKRSITITPLD